MVVIFLPLASLTGKLQERIATPSTWTVQAPHCAMPQPYFVPVSPTFSRITQRRGVSGSTSTLKALPLIVRFAIVCPLMVWKHPRSEVEGAPDRRALQVNIPRVTSAKKLDSGWKKFKSPVLQSSVAPRFDSQSQKAHHAANSGKSGAERQRHGRAVPPRKAEAQGCERCARGLSDQSRGRNDAAGAAAAARRRAGHDR